MPDIQCFLIEPTNEAHLYLRRYRSSEKSDKCPSGHGYHNAFVLIGTEGITLSERGTLNHDQFERPPKDDPRWPTTCECGYAFQDEDAWQVFPERLWKRPDTGQVYTINRSESGFATTAPAGAMWLADWLSDLPGSVYHQQRGGGPHLYVRTPGGDWDVDETATNGPGWQRSGEPPLITASPSILCNDYHGWLRNGKLIEC